MRYFSVFILAASFFLFPFKISFAESSYVLPYPTFMPGSTFYKIHLVLEKIEKYWYFGNFGQFTYNLKQADKYLVEGKTLFEYKQYLLALNALEKSNIYFIAINKSFDKSKQEGKNISEKQILFKEASIKHQEVLSDVKKQVPKEFRWSPEKNESTPLMLWDAIDRAVGIRKNCI